MPKYIAVFDVPDDEQRRVDNYATLSVYSTDTVTEYSGEVKAPPQVRYKPVDGIERVDIGSYLLGFKACLDEIQGVQDE